MTVPITVPITVPSNDDELAQIHAALAEDHIYVHPSLESKFTAEQLAAIKDNLAESPMPVFVVAYPFKAGDDYSGSTADLLTRLHAAHPEPGLYLATTKDLEVTKYTSITLEARAWDENGLSEGQVHHPALSVVRYEEHASVGSALERATELLLRPIAEVGELEESEYDAWREEHGFADSSGDGSGEGGFDATGLIVAGMVMAVVAAVVWKAFAGVRRARKPRALPPSAMARIRQANDRNLEKQARQDVLALGELIDESEIGPGADTNSWQRALDAYDAARAILAEEKPDVLDVIGAIVLSQNGVDALTAAMSGQSFTPTTRCFLNPLHGPGSHRHAVAVDGREIKAPLCTDCRNALKKDRVPDILDVARRGKPVHYFDTDAEPWASTGYGSLEPDLVRRLQGGRP